MGNSDKNTEVRNMFNSSVIARFVRLIPIEWYKHISLRFEVLGCDGNYCLKIGLELARFTQLKWHTRFDDFVMLVWGQESVFHIASKPGGHK